MDTGRAVELIKKLADGIDPYTGDVITAYSPYQNADTVRALHVALESLESGASGKAVKTDGPSKAGRKWSDEEEKRMLELFDSKMDVAKLAEELERTKGAIWARLEKLGRVSRDANGKIIVNPPPRQSAPAREELEPVAAGCDF